MLWSSPGSFWSTSSFFSSFRFQSISQTSKIDIKMHFLTSLVPLILMFAFADAKDRCSCINNGNPADANRSETENCCTKVGGGFEVTRGRAMCYMGDASVQSFSDCCPIGSPSAACDINVKKSRM